MASALGQWSRLALTAAAVGGTVFFLLRLLGQLDAADSPLPALDRPPERTIVWARPMPTREPDLTLNRRAAGAGDAPTPTIPPASAPELP